MIKKFSTTTLFLGPNKGKKRALEPEETGSRKKKDSQGDSDEENTLDQEKLRKAVDRSRASVNATDEKTGESSNTQGPMNEVDLLKGKLEEGYIKKDKQIEDLKQSFHNLNNASAETDELNDARLK